MSRKTLFLALALALPAGGAMAQASSTGVSWSYFDFGAQHIAPDADGLDNSTGIALRGSGMINPNWHVFLGWNRGKIEGSQSFVTSDGIAGVASVDDDFDRFHIGIGYNLPISGSADLFTRVAWERAGSASFSVAAEDQNFTGRLGDSDGYSIEVGVRNSFSPNFEGGASVRYVNLDDPMIRVADREVAIDSIVGSSTTSLILQGQYKFAQGWGIVGEADVNSEYRALFVGARLSY